MDNATNQYYLPAPRDRLRTSLRYFSLARVLIALMLCLLQTLSVSHLEFVEPLAFQTTGFAYLGFALLFSVMARRAWPGFYPQLLAQIIADIVLLGTMMHFAGGYRSGVALLLFVPVAAAAVLSSRRLGLFFAALASLVVLIDAGYQSIFSRNEVSFLQAGVLGIALFSIAFIINTLAQRLTAQEDVVRLAEQEIRNQAAINQLVIAQLRSGVVVLDSQGGARFVNDIAVELLCGPARQERQEQGSETGWETLQSCYRDWLSSLGPRPDEVSITVKTARSPELSAPDDTVARRLRVRFLAAPEAGDTVIVLEDQDQMEQRAQQLKLASMGRLSASIAHEVRNPLSAIRHANGLLSEALSKQGAAAQNPAFMQRLTDIVEKNSVRINRIVEDVMSMSRRDQALLQTLDPNEFLAEFKAEYLASVDAKLSPTEQTLQEQRLEIICNTQKCFYFDPQHLRRVLVNLVSNASRYASDQPGAIQLLVVEESSTEPAATRLQLQVLDDGVGLAKEMQAHLFEPFTTTEASGTGLGLFLTQELCQMNQALIRYEAPWQQRRGGFIIRARVSERQFRPQSNSSLLDAKTLAQQADDINLSA